MFHIRINLPKKPFLSAWLESKRRMRRSSNGEWHVDLTSFSRLTVHLRTFKLTRTHSDNQKKYNAPNKLK
jgi:hypothetical protein